MNYIEALGAMYEARTATAQRLARLTDLPIRIIPEDQAYDMEGRVTKAKISVRGDGEDLMVEYTFEIVRLEDQSHRLRVDFPTGRIETARWSYNVMMATVIEIAAAARLF